MEKYCLICDKSFRYYSSKKQKFCSKKCGGLSKIGIPRNKKVREKISNSHKGMKFTAQHIENLSKAKRGIIPWNKGKKIGPHTEEWKKKVSEIHKKNGLRPPIYRNENHPNWKGGITPLNEKIRKSFEYIEWRNTIFERDNYSCVWCNYKGKKLNADHIKPFAFFPELRFDINNGRTLCIKCHKKTDTYLEKAYKYRKIDKQIR